jgi:hypothetical protein
VLSPPQIRELLRDQNRVPSLQKVERALVVLAVTRQAEQAGEGWRITLKGHEVNRESTILMLKGHEVNRESTI